MAILIVFHVIYISDILIMPHNYDVAMDTGDATPPSHLLSSGQALDLVCSPLRSRGLAQVRPHSSTPPLLSTHFYPCPWFRFPTRFMFWSPFCFMFWSPFCFMSSSLNPVSEPQTWIPFCFTLHHVPLVLFLFLYFCARTHAHFPRSCYALFDTYMFITSCMFLSLKST